jgi:16S rRNA C1402 N4-methylase RsmH
MKTNREKNQEHEAKELAKELAKVRPKEPVYDHKPLEEVVRQWVTKNEQT